MFKVNRQLDFFSKLKQFSYDKYEYNVLTRKSSTTELETGLQIYSVKFGRVLVEILVHGFVAH